MHFAQIPLQNENNTTLFSIFTQFIKFTKDDSNRPTFRNMYKRAAIFSLERSYFYAPIAIKTM